MAKDPAPFDQGLFLMHMHKGKEYFENNQLQKAREELEAAHNLRPQDEKVLNLLGMAYFKLEMLPQAEEMYVTLASNNPDIYTLQSNLGLIRLKLEKLDLAEDSLIRALELQPNNPKAHLYLGLLYEKTEKWEKALEHFEVAKADKMIQKARAKIEEAKRQEEIMLPFEVLEVLAEEEVAAQAEVQVIAEEAASPVVVADRSVLPQQEVPSFSDKEIATSEWEEAVSGTEKLRRKDVIEAMERLRQPEEEEEELVEDLTPEVSHAVEEGMIEEAESAEERRAPWEKTQPTVPAPAEEPVVKAPEPATPSMSGFLAEDMAADISTFLAQTREEAPPPAESFIEEPPLAQIVDEVAAAVAAEGPREEVTEERTSPIRIPTPEEIEREERPEEPFQEEEEVIEEIVAEEAEAEEVEVVEGHLEPSALTPELPEERPVPTVPVVSEGVPPAAIIEAEQARVMERAEPGRVEAAAPTIDSTIPLQSQAMPAEYQPANLDQFSRDRFYVQPLIGADRFLLIDPHLLEIIVSGRMICRKGTVSSFTGSLSFTPVKDETIPLVEVGGSGILFLADRRKEIFLISLNNETLYVESNHLMVAQSALKVESMEYRENDNSFTMVKVSGRGTIALTCQTKPLTLKVYDSMPANIPADALIAWSGSLSADPVKDQQLKQMMMAPDEESILLRFVGSGDVVVEQGSLWGDRRAKK